MTASDDPQEDKARLRAKFKELRAKILPDLAEAASQGVWRRLFELPEYRKTSSLGAYASLPGELDTYPLLEGSLKLGKTLYLPKVVGPLIEYRRVKDLKELEPGAFGIPEPNSGESAPWGDLDLLLIPGLAFDRSGNRLGFGKGYYDRALPHLKKGALAVGLCYSFQVVDSLPTGPGDVPVAALLTEQGFTHCRR